MKRDVAIFIKTYSKDAEWLKYCLASLNKYAIGFKEIVLVCGDNDVQYIDPIAGQYNITLNAITESGNGYQFQQIVKIECDRYTACEYIAHIDSDCILTGSFTPEELFIDEKPIVLMTPYASFKPREVPWQNITEKALGIKCPYETMRRHPSVWPKWSFEYLRVHLTNHHKMPYRKYILNNSFSEFNALGSLMWHFQNSKFYWIDTSKDQPSQISLKQYWSHGGITPAIKNEIEQYLK